MRFEATKNDLIAEARAALAAADRDLRSNTRSHVAQRRTHPTVQPPPHAPVAEGHLEDRQRVIESIVNELTAIDETALDRARDQMEAAIDRYVTASSVFNRILDEMRQQLREAGGLSEEDISYRSESGRPGLRVRGTIRLQAQPWQTVSQTALISLRNHAPIERLMFENGTHLSAAELSGLNTPTESMSDDPPAPDPRQQPQPVATEPAFDREQAGELFDEMITPVLAFVRDQQAEITQLHTSLEQQSEEIAQLREQVERQTAAAERVSAWFDALREAQSRLH